MTYAHLYKSKDGWRWRMMRGGRIVATSAEAYVEKRKAEGSLVNLVTSLSSGGVRLKKGIQ
jgi:uncharacterized protein YegP (UPF0339 family)